MKRRNFLISFVALVATAVALWLAFRGYTVPQPEGALGKVDGAWLKEWLPSSARLIKVVELLPQQRDTIVVMSRDSFMGLQVKQGWDLRERGRIDQKDYGVRLQLIGDQKFVETYLGASADFGKTHKEERFELLNNSPVKVTVAVYTDKGENN